MSGERVSRTPPPEGDARGARARGLVKMPRGIRVVADETVPARGPAEPYRLSAATHPHVVLERRWFRPSLLILAFCCVFWDAVLIALYATTLLAEPAPGHETAPLWFPLLHVAVGVVITYATICGFVNTTRIAIESGVLSVRHGPLPWPGNREMAIASIAQIFCMEHEGSEGPSSYSVNALLKEGTTSTVLKGLTDAEQALYIKQLVEKRLGIVDAPVAGEYR